MECKQRFAPCDARNRLKSRATASTPQPTWVRAAGSRRCAPGRSARDLRRDALACRLDGDWTREVRLKGRYFVVAILVVLAALAARLYPLFYDKLEEIRVHVPEYQRPANVVKLEQNWTPAQRKRFHHTPQGTRLIPYAWFKALEQPCLSLLGCGLFADQAYLDRFGFIPSDADPELNPDGLPIGFAVDRDFVDPLTRKAYPVVGLNCAACHSNELYYDKYPVQIDGAPATIEVTAFQKALGVALAFNTSFPFSIGRYSRFERRVLGPNATDDQKKELRANYDAFLSAALAEKKVVDDRHIYDKTAGFRRTDALTRIGNQVFGADMKNEANYAVSTAPVRFPQIWDASWFNWVQYNSSIADPLVRNIGEALGVRAVVKLYGPDAGQFDSSVNIKGLRTLEELLAGTGPFKGLASPKWPSVFPPLDGQKVAHGAELYKQHCQACHLPPIDELIADLGAAYANGPPPKHWWKNDLGNWFMNLVDVKIDEVGTDPHEADRLPEPQGRYRRSEKRRGVCARRPRPGHARDRDCLLRQEQRPAGKPRDVGRRPRPQGRRRSR